MALVTTAKRCSVKLCGMNRQHPEFRTEQNLSIRVIEFSRKECCFSNRDHTWQQFHTVRNGVLDILAPYGTVGPMGKLPILDSYEESQDDCQVGDPKPDFFVVDDDMYGMSVRIEAPSRLAKPLLLEGRIVGVS